MSVLTVDRIKLDTIEQIIALPDHLVARVLEFVHSLREIPAHMNVTPANEVSVTTTMESLRALQNMSIDVPEEFDERQELMEALNEKYHTR